MSGTNFRSGVSVRRQYSGTGVQGDKSKLFASTKLIRKTAIIRVEADTAAGVVSSAFTLPPLAVVRDVMVNVDVPEVAVAVSVGTLANSVGDYLLAVPLDNAGLVMGDLADGAINLGILLYEETGVGGDVAYARRKDITSGGEVVTYQVLGGTDIGRFDIIVEYDEVVSEVQ